MGFDPIPETNLEHMKANRLHADSLIQNRAPLSGSQLLLGAFRTLGSNKKLKCCVDEAQLVERRLVIERLLVQCSNRDFLRYRMSLGKTLTAKLPYRDQAVYKSNQLLVFMTQKCT